MADQLLLDTHVFIWWRETASTAGLVLDRRTGRRGSSSAGAAR